VVFLSHIHLFNFSNHSRAVQNFMAHGFTKKTNRTFTRAFLSKMSQSSETITESQSLTFPVLCIGITMMDLKKIISRILHPLVTPKILSMHRNNISFTISIGSIHIFLFLFSSCALVFRLGPSLSNIPIFILSKQKFPLILPLSKHKDLRYYLFSSN
jgi:hypothetical protein